VRIFVQESIGFRGFVMFEHEHVLDILPEYALGGLEEEDQKAVSRHLSACDVCRSELLTYRSVMDQLALAAPTRVPPPALKGKVMEHILSGSRRAQPAQERGGFWGMFRSLSVAWSLASLAIILALVASNLFLWRQVNQLRQAANRTEFQTLAMAGTNAAPAASGVIVISPDGRLGTIVVDHLPPLGEDRQYQLWLIKDGERTSGGVFSVGNSGYGYMYVHSPQPLASYTGFGVTIEPAGGSPGPTGDRVLASEMK
jgi:anti-sigma-K factor RskA